jgi:hypothetical protein
MIKTNCKYVFRPVGMDLFYPHEIVAGELVKVVRTPHGCPNPRPMKMVYVESHNNPCVLVLMNSLQPKEK